MLDRSSLEKNQLRLYLGAVAMGLLLGSLLPGIKPWLEILLWPMLGLLLYATFVQVPLLHLRQALVDRRFIAAVLVGNFLFLPLAAWVLIQWLPDDPALRLGVLVVLLVPCTDWFITFTHLGGGSTSRAISITPVNLLVQLLLLPMYLWLMLPDSSLQVTIDAPLLNAALGLLAVPMLMSAITQRWMQAVPARARVGDGLAWLPVPLLALVLMMTCAANGQVLEESGVLLLTALPVFILFLLIAGLLAHGLSRALKLDTRAGRTLAFSFGTRNSFVMLPLVLALPAGWEIAVAVVVFQSLVELTGMLAYLWWVPRQLFR
ncbi:arsenic resistance protein [Halopseudomonas laoshanensis]|uniref:Arsenic resistance protein n=1 Tax=Halopseudomonas laoshanensis TaxID=2268758 RepID=A0A7V7KUJ7_9GAMM|nr:arsenic resistance protein [Halopseudomonas laoshanensis]KAA0691292.1 arsenic resistance protein [Halopseudomonas laoshanensis]